MPEFQIMEPLKIPVTEQLAFSSIEDMDEISLSISRNSHFFLLVNLPEVANLFVKYGLRH